MSSGTFLLLVARDGQTETHAFRQDVVTIGRSNECDLALPDRLISRMHCRIERVDGGFALVDLGAQNPARLRNRPVVRAELRPGESFSCGGYEITLSVPAEEHASVEDTRLTGDARSSHDLSTFLSIATALNEQRELSRLLTQIVDAAIQEDADVIGLSVLSGAHLTLFADVMDLLKPKDDNDIIVFGGGIIPEDDIPVLEEMGVARIFTPGTTTREIVQWVTDHVSPS